MFSRFARPISSNSRLISNRLLPALSCGSVRFNSTSAANYEIFKKQMDETNAIALKNRDEGVIGRFGWVPFWGMLGTIALSKEIVVVNTEFMLFCCFSSWAWVVYIGAGEMVTSALTQSLADQKTLFDKVTDWQVEKMKVYKAKTQVNVDTVPVLKEMLKQQREVEKHYLEAQNLEQRHIVRQAILDKLNQIKVREDAEAAKERTELIDLAVANVYKAFETDEGPLQVEALTNAISLLGTDGSTTLEADPVKKLFVKQFQ